MTMKHPKPVDARVVSVESTSALKKVYREYLEIGGKISDNPLQNPERFSMDVEEMFNEKLKVKQIVLTAPFRFVKGKIEMDTIKQEYALLLVQREFMESKLIKSRENLNMAESEKDRLTDRLTQELDRTKSELEAAKQKHEAEIAEAIKSVKSESFKHILTEQVAGKVGSSMAHSGGEFSSDIGNFAFSPSRQISKRPMEETEEEDDMKKQTKRAKHQALIPVKWKNRC